MKKTGKLAAILLCGVMTAGMLTGCGGATGETQSDGGAQTEAAEISVVSREDGSGTRGAFVELFGVEDEENGEKVDKTTEEATIANSTEIVMTTVSGDKNAIGYASLGSVNDSIKVLAIDGAEATTENVLNGSYKVSRPFNIATKGEPTGAAKDFMNFILSADGQQVVMDNGYIQISDDAEAFTSDGSSGEITVAGSSSVTPVMEKLKEAYEAVNPNVKITIQESDSTTGMNNTIEGVCDIGMASRELSEEELKTLTPVQIALDGIAVIVNPENPIEELSTEQVCSIFTGETTDWSEIG